MDLAIRDDQDKYEYGYTIEGKGTYEYYLSNEEWSEYLKRMSVQHRAQFNDVDGGEHNMESDVFSFTLKNY